MKSRATGADRANDAVKKEEKNQEAQIGDAKRKNLLTAKSMKLINVEKFKILVS